MLQAINITKSFHTPTESFPVLRNVSLRIRHGEFVAIVGRSGSGKSTLLNVLSTLIRPDSGEVLFKGRDLGTATEAERNAARSSELSMIFQAHHLMPYLTALENVLLPCITGLKPLSKALRQQGMDHLQSVGLANKAHSLPRALSGGEQQRVAIARSLATGAQLLFADEPTGSLDAATGDSVIKLLQTLNKNGLTIVMVTHNAEYAKIAGRTLTMLDGTL